jgi:hypothetical protein
MDLPSDHALLSTLMSSSPPSRSPKYSPSCLGIAPSKLFISPLRVLGVPEFRCIQLFLPDSLLFPSSLHPPPTISRLSRRIGCPARQPRNWRGLPLLIVGSGQHPAFPQTFLVHHVVFLSCSDPCLDSKFSPHHCASGALTLSCFYPRSVAPVLRGLYSDILLRRNSAGSSPPAVRHGLEYSVHLSRASLSSSSLLCSHVVSE